MYYELVILGTLMGGPFHGYLIAKIVQNIIGPYGKISAGRLYPLLARLEENGLIRAEPAESMGEQPENRQPPRSHIPSRSYRITGAGRERFRQVMMDTTSYLGDYQKIFLQKVVYFSFLEPSERLQLTKHYLDYCRSLALYGTRQAESLAGAGEESQVPGGMTDAQLADLLAAMQHKIEQWQQEGLWAERLREQVEASMTAPDIRPNLSDEKLP